MSMLWCWTLPGRATGSKVCKVEDVESEENAEGAVDSNPPFRDFHLPTEESIPKRMGKGFWSS
eukprot:5227728-Amphidinium_carterae.1